MAVQNSNQGSKNTGGLAYSCRIEGFVESSGFSQFFFHTEVGMESGSSHYRLSDSLKLTPGAAFRINSLHTALSDWIK